MGELRPIVMGDSCGMKRSGAAYPLNHLTQRRAADVGSAGDDQHPDTRVRQGPATQAAASRRHCEVERFVRSC